MNALALASIVVVLSALRQSLPLVLVCAALYIQVKFGDGEPLYLLEDVWAAVESPFILSIPMFLVAGALMARGAIAERLIEVARAATCWLRGGLAVATIISCAFFAAISGSSTVTMLSIGAILYPSLIRSGYPKRFALGALTSAGTLGIIIPPSIPLIVFGIVNQISVADLFLAGLVPGLFLALCMSVYALWANRTIPAERFDISRLLAALSQGIWAIMLPVILLGGIYSGYFSPTESAAVAVAYTLVVEFLIHRELRIVDFWEVLLETSRLLGTLIMILAVIIATQHVLTLLGVQEQFANWVLAIVDNPIAFLIAVNILLLIVGCFIDTISAILILSPLLLPPAIAFGINPLHFAIIMVVNLEIGLLTPPVGINLLVAMAAFREKFVDIVYGVLRFVILMIFALLVVTFVPGLSLFFF